MAAGTCRRRRSGGHGRGQPPACKAGGAAQSPGRAVRRRRRGPPHYLERGEGPPLVLPHGNGSMIQDFVSSGLVDLAARQHRVIAFDRPGYGHSPRPRGRVWSPQAQADLFRAALGRLGVSQAVILGHSWGASVALAMALKHPRTVRGLVLASGYYYPTARVDMALLSGPAVPLLGNVARYTIAPIASRLLWPLLLRKMFGPARSRQSSGTFPRRWPCARRRSGPKPQRRPS